MPSGTKIDRISFQKLLGWIGENEDEAGEAYEKLRIRLIKLFCSKGCQSAEELADETIDRVTIKIDAIADGFKGDPRLYFYGVAKNVFREHLRKPVTKELPFNLTQTYDQNLEKLERRDRCLTKCLNSLSSSEREFILDYYRGEKSTKIQNRQNLMEKLDLTPQALRVRAFRIRVKLQESVCGNSAHPLE